MKLSRFKKNNCFNFIRTTKNNYKRLNSKPFYFTFIFFLFLNFLIAAKPLNPESKTSNKISNNKQHIFYLQYKEVEFSPLNITVKIKNKDIKFIKEPKFKGKTLLKGLLTIGKLEKNFIPFVWDKSDKKLYLDLNHNLDLTDDSNGVFSGEDTYGTQIFSSIHIPMDLDGTQINNLVDIKFLYYIDKSNEGCVFNIYSIWDSEIELQEKKWHLAVVDNLDGILDSKDIFVIRPIEDHDKPFQYDYSTDNFHILNNFFFNEQAYNLLFEFEEIEKIIRLKSIFTETTPPLGQLKLTGSLIKRLYLNGDYRVILNSPNPIVNIPIGNYKREIVLLQNGDSPIQASGNFQEEITITKEKPSILEIGGPLQNSVSVDSRNYYSSVNHYNNYLNINYLLVGVGNKKYDLINQDREKPPHLTIYSNNKMILSRDFEYG